MIQNSFIFLKGINKKLERNIWKQGILNWDDFISVKKIKGISWKRKLFYDSELQRAKKELFALNSNYFFEKFPQAETWRLYDFFKEYAVFLDIETSGLTKKDYITVIGLFDGIDTKIMINGINLDWRALKSELAKYKLIVTFNGSSFDIPFLKKQFPDLLPKIPNFDLKSACRKIGLNRGLKEIEKILGIKREEILGNFHSGDPFTLWRMFRATGDDYYLQLLVKYNEEDVINLKRIAEEVVGRIKIRMENFQSS